MTTRKYHRKPNKFRKTRSKRQRGGDVNDLIQASVNGDIEKVKKILEDGADINATDEDGNTALSMAVINAQYDVVELLLDNGADINTKNVDGDTPLIHAINFGEAGDYDMVDLLLEHPYIELELDLEELEKLMLEELELCEVDELELEELASHALPLLVIDIKFF